MRPRSLRDLGRFNDPWGDNESWTHYYTWSTACDQASACQVLCDQSCGNLDHFWRRCISRIRSRSTLYLAVSNTYLRSRTCAHNPSDIYSVGLFQGTLGKLSDLDVPKKKPFIVLTWREQPSQLDNLLNSLKRTFTMSRKNDGKEHCLLCDDPVDYDNCPHDVLMNVIRFYRCEAWI